MPLREIGRKLGLAEATVRLRIKKLNEANILHIVAFADPTRLGATGMALMLLRIAPDKHEAVAETLSGWREVSYCSTTLGDDADLCAQVICADQAGLWALRQRVAGLPGVLSIRLLTELKVHKLRFTSPRGDVDGASG